MILMMFGSVYLQCLGDMNEDGVKDILDIVNLVNDILDGDDVCEEESPNCSSFSGTWDRYLEEIYEIGCVNLIESYNSDYGEYTNSEGDLTITDECDTSMFDPHPDGGGVWFETFQLSEITQINNTTYEFCIDGQCMSLIHQVTDTLKINYDNLPFSSIIPNESDELVCYSITYYLR